MQPKLNVSNVNWNLGLLFPGSEPEVSAAIEAEKAQLRAAADQFIAKWKNRKDYLENPQVLAQALDEYEVWSRNWGPSGRQGFYLSLRLSLDQNNSHLKAAMAKMEEVAVAITNDMQFFTYRLGRVSPVHQNRLLKAPELQQYRHFLEMTFAKGRYLLSQKEERVINLKQSTSHTKWVNMLEGFLSKEERQVLLESGDIAVRNFSQILNLTSNKNKAVRDRAAEAFNDILRQHLDVAENELNAVLHNKKIDDDLRRFSRPDSARHLSDDVKTNMVDMLVQAVSSRFNISQRFYALKAKLLGVERLAYHERNVEYGQIDTNYSWPEAAHLVYETLTDLDQTFGDIFAQFLQDGRIDVFPKKNKDSGAFCAPARSNLPVYILLNYTENLNDVRTLAHEMGHAINFEMMRHENELNYDCSLFLAESCSTFIEDFVLQKIMARLKDEQKLAIMMEKLNSEVSTIFRQIAFYNFETELHQKFRQVGYLSKEQIGELFTQHMISYMGDSVEQSPGSQNWWVYVQHFRNFFYVYSYAGGMLISKYLQNQVKQNRNFIEKVKVYYATGTSRSPKQILENIGVEINHTFWLSGLSEIEELLEQTTALAKKLGKI